MAEGPHTGRGGMREVARAAGVSVSTVANVLSRPSIVAPQTRQRVQEALQGIGYVPNGPARQLRGVPSPIVASITLDVANPFYAEVNRGIEDRLAQDDCLLLACSTDLRPGKEKQLLTLLRAQAVRGVLICPIGSDLAPLTALSRSGTPVVLIDHPRGRLDLCAAAVDDVLGGQLACEHLLSLGHRRIAFVGDMTNPASVAARRDGIRLALSGAGHDPDKALLDIRLPPQPRALVDAAAAIVGQILHADRPPTAVICLNDTAALGVLDGLQAAGIAVPADISVVGYDDLPFARRLAPPLTTVSQPKYDLGQAAAELLLHEGHPNHTHREIRFPPSLMIRSSTAPPRRGRRRSSGGT